MCALRSQALHLLLLLLVAHGSTAQPEALRDATQDPADLFGAEKLLQAVNALEEEVREDPTGEGEDTDSKNPFGVVSDAVGKIKRQAEQVVDEVNKQINKTKPLMNRINSMRAQLCWTREDLWSHQECLKFLGLQCKGGTTGKGICSRFKEDVEKHCVDVEQSSEDQKVFCKLAKALGIRVGEEEKEITEDEAKAEELVPGSEANATKDSDGDGVPDEEDAFPDDPQEWSDMDGDGRGDNSDDDIDGDGHQNDKEKYPKDASRWTDDRDGDGHPDEDDAFPDDPKEWSDLDGDGIGDNSDDDIDGDGVPNKHDMYPLDATKAISDRDGDGHRDEEDAFPDDPEEWKDTDGDGIGDNADAYPNDPDCWQSPCIKDGNPAYNKVRRPLPSQGYDEHSKRMVEHKDDETWTGDWRSEWPTVSEQEMQSILRICKDHPDNAWCGRFKRQLGSGK